MIVVVGAGIAGLTCAAELAREGEDVLVLEGRERAGGRCWTDDRLGVPVDLGASWIHGVQHNPLMQMARRYACDVEPFDYSKCAVYDGSGKLPKKVRDEALAFEEWLASWAERLCYKHPKKQPDISVAAAMAQELDRGRTRIKLKDRRIFDWALHCQGLSEGISLGQVGLRYYEDDDPFDGGDALFRKGTREIVRDLAEGLDIEFGHRVTHITYGDGGCVVETDQGSFNADRVVVTLPLGVLKRGDVTFEPELPEEKQWAIEAIGMGTLNKIAVRFERSFWGKGVNVLSKISAPHRHAAWMLNLEPVVEAPILVGFDTHDGTSKSDDEVLGDFLSDLEACFGDAVERVEGYVVTRWQDDPWADGAYAHLPVGASGVHYDELARTVDEVLYFAGEATHRDHPATMNGAAMSGLRVAEEILRWG